jgi:hypothetical protein
MQTLGEFVLQDASAPTVNIVCSQGSTTRFSKPIKLEGSSSGLQRRPDDKIIWP